MVNTPGSSGRILASLTARKGESDAQANARSAKNGGVREMNGLKRDTGHR